MRSDPVTRTGGSNEGFQPSRPLRAAAFVLAPLPLPVTLWASGVLAAPAALGFGISLVLLALVQGGLGIYDLHRSRRLGDGLLRAYPGLPPVSGLAAWRSAELTSARSRRRLRRRVRQLRCETEACTRSGAPPIDSAVVGESLALLRELESRLELLAEPVSPFGMLELQALVRDELSPLYFPERAGALPAALAQALTSLEPR